MHDVVFSLPAGMSAEAVVSEIGGHVRLCVEPTTALRRVHLDTFDWRLWSAGGRLAFEHVHDGGRLLWSGDRESQASVVPAVEPPRCGADLPDTIAGRRIATLIEPRALLPLGVVAGQRRAGTVLDRRDKAVARLSVDETVGLGPDDQPSGATIAHLRLEGLTGFDGERDRVAALLRSVLGLERADDDELSRAASARGRKPGDYSSKVAVPLRPEEPIEGAVRRMLGALLDTVVANAPGASQDLDPEFLHDLRVAGRRSRSIIGQLEPFVPADFCQRLTAELRWLGSVTGPVRDLDVFLIELDGLVGESRLTDCVALAPFLELLHRRRARAQHELVEAVSGDRFARLATDWRAAIAEPFALSQVPKGGRPVAGVARKRIRRALHRVMRRGTELAAASPLPEFHRLRIDAKKLRYLLELFAALLPERKAASRVKVLKRLQDVLGGLQDVSVQRTRIDSCAAELASTEPTPAATLLAMGRLTVALDAREAAHRAAFHDRFAGFQSTDGRASWNDLLNPEWTP